MGFIQPSSTSAKVKATSTSQAITDLDPTTQVSALSQSLALNQSLSTTKSGGVLAQASNATTVIRSALASALSTFDKRSDSLASSVSGQLSGLFKNTSVAKASTVSTAISDPVSQNLGNRKPTATSFKVSGLEAGSQALTDGKTRSGSGADQMVGTSLITLVNRLKLDISAVKSLPNAIATRFSSQKLNGLFNTATKGTGVSTGSITTLASVVSASTKRSVSASIGTGSAVSTSISQRDLADFTTDTSQASEALGGLDFSGYYMSNSKYSIVNQDGVGVNTNKSGVDSSTANAILNLIRAAGCSTNTSEYMSANKADSLFGLSLLLAALEGMTDLVSDLLNCSHSSTLLGQQALGRAATEVAGTQPTIAASILDKVDAPHTLYTPDLGISILSNPNLTAANKTSVDSLFTSLGTTTQSAMSIPAASSAKYPVYDTSILPGINSGFTNAVFSTSAINDYLNGRTMVAGANGKIGYA